MVVVGLVGGIASGKSLVGRQLQSLGAVLIVADQIGHEVLNSPVVRAALVQRWGSGILDASDRIDRREVARRVFGPGVDANELRFLEQWTHPAIGARIKEELSELAASAVVVLDAPLLLKAGWDTFCDGLVFVEVEQSLREARAMQRGWTVSELHARETAQGSLEEKRQRSRWTIDNSGTQEQTMAQVKGLWQELTRFPSGTARP
ncbi:MAG: dephospho-CoA kinase [Planctomycetes bacterium]|nr:dephospho-CoA kinase [Planctomycetota bacterium]